MVSGTRPRGRPRKTSAEKAEQFSVRMPALNKTFLEMYSRATGQSLSQAVADMVLKIADDFQVEGETLASIQKRNLDRVMEKIIKPLSNKIAVAHDFEMAINWMAEKQSWLLEDEIGRLFLYPQSLLTPEESFFVDVCFAVGMLPEKEEAQSIYNDASVFCVFEGGLENAAKYVKTRLSKHDWYEKILSHCAEKGASYNDSFLKPLEALKMLKPLEALEGIPEPKPASKGPVPRKRFPKK